MNRDDRDPAKRPGAPSNPVLERGARPDVSDEAPIDPTPVPTPEASEALGTDADPEQAPEPSEQEGAPKGGGQQGHKQAPEPIASDQSGTDLRSGGEEETGAEDGDATGEPVQGDLGRVREMLNELSTLAARCGMRSLSSELVEERLPALERGQITLVVLGEFNHGKSTVVNALLGEPILPVGITPTTAVITHLVWSEEPRAAARPAGGGAMEPIEFSALGRAVSTSEESGADPDFIEIGYPNEVLADSLVLVDTPGVNDISRQKVEITYGYLPRADVILYVLDATQVLKKSEVTFIRDRLLRANRDRILFVLNKIDALSPEDVAEVESYARERLTALLGPVELYAFSGRAALEAARPEATPPEAFSAFRDALARFLKTQRAYIILDSALGGAQRVASMLEQNLAIKRSGFELEGAELDRRIEAVRARLSHSRKLVAENGELIESRIAGIEATATHNLRVFTEKLTEQLPVQIERAEAADVQKHLPGWITSVFKEWLEREGQQVARSLEELAEEVIEITNESLRETVEAYRDEFGLKDALDLDVDTIAYDVSVFALGAFGVSMFLFANMLVGSLLTLATPLLAYLFKGKIDAQIKERARAEGAEAVRETSEKLADELARVVRDYGDRLSSFVETAGDKLYRQIDEALVQVQRERAEGTDREALLTRTDALLGEVRDLRRRLASERARLLEEVA